MTTARKVASRRNPAPSVIPTPTILSPEAWEAAHRQMLAKEKALTRTRGPPAADRLRMRRRKSTVGALHSCPDSGVK